MANVQVESRELQRRFARLDSRAQAKVKDAIEATTRLAFQEARTRANVPVTDGQRSRPGQSPRRESGRLWRSLMMKLSPKGWVGYVSSGKEAEDAQGRRYPWMLESGTKWVRKRPLFKAIQKDLKRRYQQMVGRAMIDAVRGS